MIKNPVTNLQGDVVAILNGSGTAVVSYTYDAWGNVLSTTGSLASTLGTHNPLRYRGYVYDAETGLYYLQSRYYDPTTGRFLNADAYASTGQGILGNNMFAYCLNNPINNSDAEGLFTRRQIHDAVLANLVAFILSTGRRLYMTNTTIYYNGHNYLGGWGFCDLYDLGTGEVWELKRITCSKLKAQHQLEGYTSGRLKIDRSLELKIGGELFEGKRNFTISDDTGTYNITYWQGEDGILWYNYSYEKSDSQKVQEAVALAGIALGITNLVIGTLGSGRSSKVQITEKTDSIHRAA